MTIPAMNKYGAAYPQKLRFWFWFSSFMLSLLSIGNQVARYTLLGVLGNTIARIIFLLRSRG